MSRSFVHLHVHSEYSLLDGSGSIEGLVRKAAEQGMKALALTDHGVMYGTIPFYQTCHKYGIQPIIGMEVYVTQDLQPSPATKRKKGDKRRKLFHLTLLAETYEGYQHLLALTSKAHLEGFYDKPRVTKDWLREYGRGLICLSGCLSGELQQALLTDQEDKAERIALEHQALFGEDYYFLELQDHGMPEQQKVNARLLRLAEKLNIPPVVTNDVHYISARDAVAHDCLLCIGTNAKVAEEERLKFPSKEFHLKNAEEMWRLFPHVPEAYENTERIARRCRVELPLGGEILPRFPVPEGYTAEQYLREQCTAGLSQRYATITEEIRHRLEYELEIISRMGYADYFLIVWDFMRFAHEQGIMTGPGRGSAAGSLVAYVLKITNVDPIRYHLLFERFLNPERVTMPDIDIDFSDSRRDEVIQYVADRYGKDRVAQIITFGTLGAKASVRDVGRALGVPAHLIDQVSKHIPSRPGMNLRKAYQESEALQRLTSESRQVAHVLNVAGQLEGLARHTSTHAAGIVISSEPLTRYVPLQAGHDQVALTQYAMEDLEALGLLKMDLLGLRNLSLMEQILRMIQRSKAGKEDSQSLLTVDEIPLEDPQTFALLSRGDTSGIFQLESAGMRQVLKRLQPSSFEDLVAVLALYRPGPMENIPLFIDAKHGKTDVSYPHKDLKDILKDTYGIIVYQEQIMQIASKMAGFSLGEADLLRRAVSKKKRDVLEQEREHFIHGCLQQGYEQQVAEHVYDLIVRFADYGFNRSHSVAYAVIAFQLAYLKTHYPVAFLASLLSMNMGDEQKTADYLQQAASRNIRVLSPSVIHSQADFTIEGQAIRFGLSVIKHVGQTAIQEIIKARSEKPFRNLLDFCQRVNLRICHRRVIESLILAGAMDELGMHRAQAVANLDTILDMAEQAQGLRQSDQLFFFAEELPADYEWPDVPRYTHTEQLKEEKAVLGFYLSGHPLDSYRDLAQRYHAQLIPDMLTRNKASARIRTLGYVNKVKRIKTKKGEPMAFVELEDKGMVLEAIAFPQVYRSAVSMFEEGRMLFVEGKTDMRNERLQLMIHKVTEAEELIKLHKSRRISKPPEGPVSGSAKESQASPASKYILFIKITPRFEQADGLQALHDQLRSNPGKTPVYLYYERSQKTWKLGREYDVHLSESFLQELRDLLGNKQAVQVKKI